jgi:FkbH-like protein
MDDRDPAGQSGHATDVPDADPIGRVMERLAWQRRVFAERPRRLDLLRWRATWPLQLVRIRVHRNQPFEFVASVMAPFLAVADLEPSFDIGPYDDALSGVGEPGAPTAGVEILWLDFGRYLDRQEPEAVVAWLADRVRTLRRASAAPILVAGSVGHGDPATRLNTLLGTALEGIAGTHVLDQAAVADEMGEEYTDQRSERFAGTSLSDAAAIETARRFGLVWIPAVLAPRLKVIVVDLDDTLYDGVLGEDGFAALRLSDDRAALQRRLVELADSGFLIAVLSKNEPKDVERLFSERLDFPLRPEKLSAMVASWRPKVEGMASIIERLRVGPDSVLFVDDNLGELATVADGLPGIVPLHAADAGQALRGLRWRPGLAVLRSTREDSVRAADLASIETRRALETTAPSPLAYLRSLDVRLGFALSPVDQLSRIHELSTKTNQFNTGFLRLSEADVAARLADSSSSLVTISLQDRLSDSGVIGLIVIRTVPGTPPLVEEVAISCRALGRGVEDAIIGEALRGALGSSPPDRVRFRFVPGPRNGPARDWLGRVSSDQVEPPEVEVPWLRLEEAREAVASAVELVWREP